MIEYFLASEEFSLCREDSTRLKRSADGKLANCFGKGSDHIGIVDTKCNPGRICEQAGSLRVPVGLFHICSLCSPSNRGSSQFQRQPPLGYVRLLVSFCKPATGGLSGFDGTMKGFQLAPKYNHVRVAS